MIIKNNKYKIDGWAILIVIEIIKSLKLEVQKKYKSYSKIEFLEILDKYDFAINYLLSLSEIEVVPDDNVPELNDDIINFLRDMKISVNTDNIDSKFNSDNDADGDEDAEA